MKYRFTVVETLVKQVEIEADDVRAAWRKGDKMYSNEEIVLSGDDFFGVEYEVEPVEENEN